MSPTNIHYAHYLLQRAGCGIDDQATIRPFELFVYTTFVEEFSQEDLNKYTGLFNHGIEGHWLSNANDPTKSYQSVNPSSSLAIPRLSISRVFRDKSEYSQPRPQDQAQKPDEPLDYILVVQGKQGSERSKVLVEHSLDVAATSMLHEAMNGFSIIFTGALLRSNMHELFASERTRKLSFKKMPDVAALNEFHGSRESQSTRQLGVLC